MADRNLRIRMVLEAADRLSKPLKDIAAGGGRVAQVLAGTRDRLKQIQRAQADIGGFRQLKQGLRTTSDDLERARARASALGRQLHDTATPTRQLRSEFARAKQEAEQLAQRHEKETRALGAMRERLAAAGIATRDLARHERDLRQEADRTADALERQTRRAEQMASRRARIQNGRERFDRLNDRATSLAAGGGSAIATGLAVEAPVIASVKSAMDYESVMTDIAQKADLTRAQARVMGLEMLKSAKAANQMPEAMQQGVDVLMGFGANLPDARAMITPIGRAATAYKAEMADMAAATFAVHDNLKVAAGQTGRVIDVMAQAGKSGAFEMKDMAQYFPQLTAGYQGLGQQGVGAVADLAAALQIARKGAGDSASAATNLSNVLQKIASPATIKKFKEFGVDLPAALKRAYAEGKTPIEAIAELTNKTLKGNLGKLGFLFEDAQVQQGLRPLIQNLAEYRKIRGEALNAKGATDRDFAERMNDGAEKAKRLGIQAKAAGIAIGTQLQPMTNAASEKLAIMAERVARWADRNPVLVKTLAVMAATLGILFAVMGGGAIAVAGLVAPFAALSFAAGALNIAMLPLAGIALGIVAAVALLAAGAYLIYANWDKIKAFFVGLWDGVKAKFAAVMAWFEGLKGRFSTFGSDLINGLINGFTGKLAALKKAITGAASSVASWFKEKLGIRSPSRVFRQLGGFVVQGLDDGLGAGSSAPLRRMGRLARDLAAKMEMKPRRASVLPGLDDRARDLAALMRVPAGRLPLPERVEAPQKRLGALSARVGAALAVGAAIPAVASPAAPAGAQRSAPAVGGDTYHISVTAAPGMDEKRLVELLERKLREIAAKKAAARGSAFADRQDWDG